ncbi:twin-arginine translocation signal domain-containing protein [Natribaculum luteum]|uniref:Twin-arginine translocation signal domain-containing protein n=1 Tax=Natribaculum luteum TaxID=1586232 RepID=A0ABD5NUW4_9EURY|nr:twin-arginine translocation signal domain-containing protein [Natribaculum luteum]
MTSKNRRKFLKGIGAVTAGTFLAGNAAGSETQKRRPVIASGTRIAEIEQTSRGWEISRKFLIDTVEEEFRVSRQDRVTTTAEVENDLPEFDREVDFGTETISTTNLDSETKSEIDDLLEEGTERFKDTAVLGTFQQHYEYERDLIEVTPMAEGPLPDSSISLHVYNADDPSWEGDLTENTGPINLVWNNGDDADDIDDDWQYNGHSSIALSGTRYIATDTYSVKEQDEDIGWNIAPIQLPSQWHARVYTIDGNIDIDAVGQAHRDPPDHGHLPGDTNWQFFDSRETFSDQWNDVSTLDADNGDEYDSSDGEYDYIEGEYEEDDDGGIPIFPIDE